ncbi:hypothetical protein CEXT_639601 [Caerostris extrusa]|uniref:Uncharacterized protein n=1 Tax=Caerostris extrusa TaxID=172846 RepID=A0AAV4MDM9_CAEEX|nr:hypothetical protein CEXT_639601 [Caerostris extrusa]
MYRIRRYDGMGGLIHLFSTRNWNEESEIHINFYFSEQFIRKLPAIDLTCLSSETSLSRFSGFEPGSFKNPNTLFTG